MQANSAPPKFVNPGIILLTAAIAIIHLSLNFIMGQFDLMFTLNGLGYLALMAMLFLDIPLARDNRKLVRYGLIGFAAVTVIAWVFIGDKNWWLGWLTVLIELALTGLLIIKRP